LSIDEPDKISLPKSVYEQSEYWRSGYTYFCDFKVEQKRKQELLATELLIKETKTSVTACNDAVVADELKSAVYSAAPEAASEIKKSDGEQFQNGLIGGPDEPADSRPVAMQMKDTASVALKFAETSLMQSSSATVRSRKDQRKDKKNSGRAKKNAVKNIVLRDQELCLADSVCDAELVGLDTPVDKFDADRLWTQLSVVETLAILVTFLESCKLEEAGHESSEPQDTDAEVSALDRSDFYIKNIEKTMYWKLHRDTMEKGADGDSCSEDWNVDSYPKEHWRRKTNKTLYTM
jgi:hypothetical protein